MVEEIATRLMKWPLAPGRPRLLHRVGERHDVLDQLVGGKRGLADAGLNDAGLLGAKLDRAALGALDRVGDVHRHRADLGIGHQAARTQNLTEAADQRHQIRRGDDPIEIDGAALNFLHQVLGADDVGAGGFGLIGLGAAGKYRYPHRAARSRSAD